MSVNLTTALQNVSGRDPNYVDSGPVGGPPGASRQTGLLLLDSDTVTFTAGPLGIYDTITATAAGGSAPSGAENLVYSTPNGASGDASLRALVSADLPAATNSAPGAVVSNLIETITVASPQVGVTFSDIPQNFQNLKIVGSYSVPSGGANLTLQFNGDTGTNYSYNFLWIDSGVPTGSTESAQVSIFVGIGTESSVTIDIPNYHGTLALTSVTAQASQVGSTTGGNWTNSGAAVTSIKLVDSNGADFAAGTTFTLYGY